MSNVKRRGLRPSGLGSAPKQPLFVLLLSLSLVFELGAQAGPRAPELETLPSGWLRLLHRGPAESVPSATQAGWGTAILGTRILVPAVSIYEAVFSLTTEEAWPLAVDPGALTLPQKAARVDGKTLDQAGYSLVEWDIIAWPPEAQPSAELLALATAGLPGPAARTVFTGFVGDLMLGRGVDSLLATKGPQAVFTDTLPLLQGYDILGGNLEGVVGSKGAKTNKTYNFRYPPSVLPALISAGFDHVMLSNNHAWDYGPAGFLETLDNLEEAGLPWSGGGRNLEAARTPLRLALPQDPSVADSPAGANFFICSFGAYPVESKGFNGQTMAAPGPESPGIVWASTANVEALGSQIRPPELSQEIALAQIHGGAEYVQTPRAKDQATYRSLIDAGFDLVVGSHPHVLQGFEVYQGKLIVYSLGNFVFPGMEDMAHALDSIILSCGWYQGLMLYFEPQGAKLSGRTVSLDKSGKVLESFYKLSKKLSK